MTGGEPEIANRIDIPIVRWENGESRAVRDAVSVEEPSEIFIDDQPSYVTMRTPGPLSDWPRRSILPSSGSSGATDAVFTVARKGSLPGERTTISGGGLLPLAAESTP